MERKITLLFFINLQFSCNEWVSDYCLVPNEQFSSISWQKQVTFGWDDYDDDVHFVLNQHA